jgi:14-3-3 protein
LKGAKKHLDIVRKCRKEIETELEQVCQDVLDLLDEYLIPKAESGSVGHQILKIQVLPGYLPGFSLAGTYLTSRQNPGTYLTFLTQVLRYSDNLITCCNSCCHSSIYESEALIIR